MPFEKTNKNLWFVYTKSKASFSLKYHKVETTDKVRKKF